MIRILLVTILTVSLGVNPRPIACKEDYQCISGYFCEVKTYLCRECLRCQDLRREPSKSLTGTDCIKSADECGPCFEGLVKDYSGDIDAKCVLPLMNMSKYFTIHVYLSYTAALIGCLFAVVTIVYLFQTTSIVKIVAYPTFTTSPISQIKINVKQ